ncbi:hypothetical protein SOVF_141790 isoform A [Spinacia oleracea]|nr:hypothetical protein SOVF_141790 isoform A [Spinacia oleracea]
MSRKSLTQLFSRFISLDRHQGGIIEDDWEYIEILDRKFSSGDEEDDYASMNGLESEMGDQEKTNFNGNYKMKCKVLSKAEVRQRLEDNITNVSTVLLLPRNEAAILLQHFKWCVNGSNDEWLACEQKVREAVGLYVRPVEEIPADATEVACGMCLVDYPRDSMSSVSCGHQICHSCWEAYIKESINDGPRCLTLRCPDSFCGAAVGFDFIERLLSSEEDKIKFENHLLRSYLSSSGAKWCPAPDCNYAVFSYDGEEGSVTCQCSHSFCWSCSRESHAPVDCNTADKWMSEGPLHSEIWMLTNTVECPVCKSRYEKDALPYVQCEACKHEFCSVCGDDWGYYAKHGTLCSSNGDVQELTNKLQRYQHHYKAWATCESSRTNALSDLKVFQDLQLDGLYGVFGLPLAEFNFIVEALEQVAQCWQILKWTYVYGYYLSSDKRAKEEFLEFRQEHAKHFLNRLHKHAEERQDFLNGDGVFLFVQFRGFQNRLATRTRVARKYFHGLLEDIMNGLPEVGVSIPKFSPSQISVKQEEESNNSASLMNPDELCGPGSNPSLISVKQEESSNSSLMNPDELCGPGSNPSQISVNQEESNNSCLMNPDELCGPGSNPSQISVKQEESSNSCLINLDELCGPGSNPCPNVQQKRGVKNSCSQSSEVMRVEKSDTDIRSPVGSPKVMDISSSPVGSISSDDDESELQSEFKSKVVLW